MIKTNKFLFLILFLTSYSLSEELILHENDEDCDSGYNDYDECIVYGEDCDAYNAWHECIPVKDYSLTKELVLHESDGKAGQAFCLECKFTDFESMLECLPLKETAVYGVMYKCTSGESIRKTIILENPKIELEYVAKNRKYVPKNLRKRFILKNRVNGNFLNDINKMTLFNATENSVIVRCYEVNIYDNENLIATFETDGISFYDNKNKLLYWSDEDLLVKYWYVIPENHCL
jgi:hypothetical protein